MGFESLRGYFQLASGLGELSRARAMEAAQGLLSLPGVGIATGKVAVQVGTLAEELLAAATTNREHLTTLVRSEVDAAVTRLGLVPAEKLEQSRAETARLRAEVAELRSASTAKRPASSRTAAAKTAPRTTSAGKAAAKKRSASKSAARPAAVTKVAPTASTAAKTTAVRRSSVTTRRKPAGA